jgi:hypothetical protein
MKARNETEERAKKSLKEKDEAKKMAEDTSGLPKVV